jgi:hypothetical protein
MKVRNLYVNESAELRAMVRLTRNDFFNDRQGRTFADLLDEPQLPFEQVLAFFNDPDRQRRMEEAEIHHDRPALAGVVRELESLPAIDAYLADPERARSKRLRQAIGVVVRIVMESRGWRKTGKKGSLGVRAGSARKSTATGENHNTGGLAFWFLRAERYERIDGMPFRSVRERCRQSAPTAPRKVARTRDANWKPTAQSAKTTRSSKLFRKPAPRGGHRPI